MSNLWNRNFPNPPEPGYTKRAVYPYSHLLRTVQSRRNGGLRPETAPRPRHTIVSKVIVAQNSKAYNLTAKSWEDPVIDNSRPTEFMDLPTAVRFQIYNKIPTKQRVWLQLVCRKMRDDIRVRIGIGTMVNEHTSWGVSFMRDILIDTIVVGAYRQPELRPKELILRWYDALHLHFFGPISMPYMDAFVGRCRGVRKISVTTEISERPPIPLDPEKKRDYKSWRKLDIIRKNPYKLTYCKLLEICPIGRLHHLSVQWTLEVCHCINIVKLKILITLYMKIHDTRSMHTAILKFVENHPTLQEVWVYSKVSKFTRLNRTKFEFLRPTLEIKAISKNIHLRQLSILEDNVDFLAWGYFILEQQNLEIFQLLHCQMFPVVISVIMANAATLTKIAIHTALGFNFTPVIIAPSSSDIEAISQFSLAVFQECYSLKELYICLSKSPKSKYGVWDNELTDFSSLPKTLEVLGFRNVSFHDQEFVYVSVLPKLKSLGVSVCVSHHERLPTYNNSLLGALFSMRSLEELMMEGFAFCDDEYETMMQLKRYVYRLERGCKNILYIRGNMHSDLCPATRWEPVGLVRRYMRFKIKDDNIVYEV